MFSFRAATLLVMAAATSEAFRMAAPLAGSRATRGSRPALNMAATAGPRAVPHGGDLIENMAADVEAAKAACTMELQLNDRQLCDVELLMNGGFSPLEGYMGQAAYESVVENMALPDGLIFGLPIVFDTDREDIVPGTTILLKQGDRDIATLTVEEKWVPDKVKEAFHCYGSTSIEHPAVQMITMERGKYYIGGKVQGIEFPVRDFPCASPKEVRAMLPENEDVIAFQCRNPIHRAHYELFTRALSAPEVTSPNPVVLVHPTCGPTQPGDIDGTVRYKTYLVLQDELKANPDINDEQILWAYLPYAMHMAGPREAIQHSIIRKNYGCTGFIIGRDMAGCKSSLTGEDFYGGFDAQDLLKEKGPSFGITAVPSLNLVYTAEEGYIVAEDAKEKGYEVKKLSGTKFRAMMRNGDDIPEWFAFKSVVDVLRANMD